MVRHIVLFWLEDNARENLETARAKLLSMEGKIEGLLSIEVGLDIEGSERSCDLCLNMVFASKEALNAYRTHPVHVPVQQHMHKVRRLSYSADYFMADE